MSDPSLPGTLLILSGPAGVGKSTVGEALLKRNPGITRSVSATTRAPRGAEMEGVDYYFMTRESFEAELARGLFLEYAEVHGNLYGTPLRPVLDALEAGKVVLMIIDVDGAAKVRALGLDALLVFLMPPDEDALLARMRARASEPEQEIYRRLARARREMDASEDYDAVIVNDGLDACVDEVEQAVHGHRRQLAARGAAGRRLYPGLAKLREK